MVQGTGKMVWLSECSSYWVFELSSDFYEKVLVKVQREFKNSLSYWKFELSVVGVIRSVLYVLVAMLTPKSKGNFLFFLLHYFLVHVVFAFLTHCPLTFDTINSRMFPKQLSV